MALKKIDGPIFSYVPDRYLYNGKNIVTIHDKDWAITEGLHPFHGLEYNYLHAFIYLYIYIDTHINIHTFIYAHTCMNIYLYIYTHI